MTWAGRPGWPARHRQGHKNYCSVKYFPTRKDMPSGRPLAPDLARNMRYGNLRDNGVRQNRQTGRLENERNNHTYGLLTPDPGSSRRRCPPEWWRRRGGPGEDGPGGVPPSAPHCDAVFDGTPRGAFSSMLPSSLANQDVGCKNRLGGPLSSRFATPLEGGSRQNAPLNS